MRYPVLMNDRDNKDKHDALLGAAGAPRVGRREAPEAIDRKTRRMLLVRGLVLGAVVVAVTLVIIAVVGANNPL